MEIDFSNGEVQTFLKEIYDNKLASICGDSFMKVINVMVEKPEISAKMATLALIGGRDREGYEIVQAALDLD